MKRSLLPLNALRVFDAAARHLSFTRAADELAVTPAAVGQQIRALEDLLGVILFRRTPRGLELTDEGAAGLDTLRQGFEQFEEAVQAMRAGQSSAALAIAAPVDVTARWLMPRIAAFPGTDAQRRWSFLPLGDNHPAFSESNLDAAIIWANSLGDEWEGVVLPHSELVCVAKAEAPDVAIAVTAFEHHPSAAPVALRCADAGSAIAAVLAGLGHAQVPRLLVERELAGGVLNEREGSAGAGRYWLVAPRPQWRQRKVQQLVSWLTAD